jgi:hypothetical protein
MEGKEERKYLLIYTPELVTVELAFALPSRKHPQTPIGQKAVRGVIADNDSLNWSHVMELYPVGKLVLKLIALPQLTSLFRFYGFFHFHLFFRVNTFSLPFKHFCFKSHIGSSLVYEYGIIRYAYQLHEMLYTLLYLIYDVVFLVVTRE